MYIEYVDLSDQSLMKDGEYKIRHDIFNKLPFRIQKITLLPNREIDKKIIEDAKLRLASARFNSANSSGNIRDAVEVRIKGFCGLIIEQVCYSMLKHYNNNENVTIELDNSNSPIDQVDLRIIKKWINSNQEPCQATKTVEIRSSFPFKPISQVVSKDFDILGAYTNQVKKTEIEKDFYLRFLFSLDYTNQPYVQNNQGKIDYSATTTKVLKDVYFDENLCLKRDLTIYFVGGVTKDMMLDETIAYDGSMKSTNFNKSENAAYRKIKIRNALDCVSITQLMLNVILDEARQGK